jgi:hypothetical protein
MVAPRTLVETELVHFVDGAIIMHGTYIASKTLILDNISGKMALRYHYTRV